MSGVIGLTNLTFFLDQRSLKLNSFQTTFKEVIVIALGNLQSQFPPPPKKKNHKLNESIREKDNMDCTLSSVNILEHWMHHKLQEKTRTLTRWKMQNCKKESIPHKNQLGRWGKWILPLFMLLDEIWFKTNWSVCLLETFQVRTCDPRLAAIKTFPILEASSLILPFSQTLTRNLNFWEFFTKNLFCWIFCGW